MQTNHNQIYPQSNVDFQGTRYFLTHNTSSGRKHLCVRGDTTGFLGEHLEDTLWCPLTGHNAKKLKERIPWLNPQPLGINASFGFGDRLGIATPGHIAALGKSDIAPIFAQQSVRENNRTGRDPQKVLDDAMWGVFQTGWTKPWGADADHTKEISDLAPFIQAGYSVFTIDPNEYVDNEAHFDSPEVLKAKVNKLPWEILETNQDDLFRSFITTPIEIDNTCLKFKQNDLLRAAAKYGRAVAHSKLIADYLVKEVNNFDLEISVDETDTPTTVHEHYYIASELRRLGVPFTSLAPRFVGSFEKGVDYIGDLKIFDTELERHAAIIHHLGGYKLSIHTGSDKFSIYSSIAKHTHRLVHVKTAGTSYLEALRVIATVDKAFFRQLLDFARSRYETDKVSYIISAQLDRVPAAAELSDDELSDLLELFDARQVLHVTYGSILDKFHNQFMKILQKNLDLYYQFLKIHFHKHLEPLKGYCD